MNPFRLAGIALIATSLGFVAVFGYLASHFGYPDVLEGKAADVLPAFVAGGGTMRAVWVVYAILPAGIALSAILAAASMTVGAFRNLTSLVAPIAALNNNLLPVFLIGLGAALIASSRQPLSSA
jgi:hypothetical protein